MSLLDSYTAILQETAQQNTDNNSTSSTAQQGLSQYLSEEPDKEADKKKEAAQLPENIGQDYYARKAKIRSEYESKGLPFDEEAYDKNPEEFPSTGTITTNETGGNNSEKTEEDTDINNGNVRYDTDTGKVIIKKPNEAFVAFDEDGNPYTFSISTNKDNTGANNETSHSSQKINPLAFKDKNISVQEGETASSGESSSQTITKTGYNPDTLSYEKWLEQNPQHKEKPYDKILYELGYDPQAEEEKLEKKEKRLKNASRIRAIGLALTSLAETIGFIGGANVWKRNIGKDQNKEELDKERKDWQAKLENVVNMAQNIQAAQRKESNAAYQKYLDANKITITEKQSKNSSYGSSLTTKTGSSTPKTTTRVSIHQGSGNGGNNNNNSTQTISYEYKDKNGKNTVGQLSYTYEGNKNEIIGKAYQTINSKKDLASMLLGGEENLYKYIGDDKNGKNATEATKTEAVLLITELAWAKYREIGEKQSVTPAEVVYANELQTLLKLIEGHGLSLSQVK